MQRLSYVLSNQKDNIGFLEGKTVTQDQTKQVYYQMSFKALSDNDDEASCASLLAALVPAVGPVRRA